MKSTKSATDPIAFFAALCVFLSTLEYLIPKPIPFFRLGLANLPILLSLYLFSPKQILLLILLKVVGQGFINGTLFSYIFVLSFIGSFSGGIVMIMVSRVFGHAVSLIGISICGALASNFSQLGLARLFLGEGIVVIAPPFLAIGLASSVFLGVIAFKFSQRSRWYRELAVLGGES